MTSLETQQEEGYQLAPQQLARSGEAGGTASRTFRTTAHIAGADLEARIAAAVSAHEILRTRYRELSGMLTPVQVVDPAGPVTIDRQANGVTVFRAGALTVEQEPGPDGTRLVLSLPRLSVDDESWSSLAGLLLGDPVAEAELQYADIAAWLGEVLAHSARPADDEPAPALPFLKPGGHGDAVRVSAVVEGPALDRLDELAVRHGVSEAAVLLALWRALSGRYGQDADDRVVVLSDGRSTEGLETVLGLLERPVPVRLEFTVDTPIADALRAAQEVLGFVATIENEVDPGTVGGGISYRHREDRWDGQLSAEEPATGLLHLDCVRGSRSLRLTFVGDAGRIAQADLDLVAAAYGHQLADLLAGSVERGVGGLRLTAPGELGESAGSAERGGGLRLAAPGAPDELAGSVEPGVGGLRLTTPGTPDQPTGPETRYPSVPERFLDQAARTPDRPALRCGETVLSYRDVALRADTVARLLREHGVSTGDRVALLAPASAETVVAMLGIWFAGAAFVPVDPAWPEQRVETILREAAPALLLTPDPETDPGVSVRTISAAATETAGAAYVIFTSGTSGVPKGVVIGHDQVAHYTAAIEKTLGLSEGAEFAAVSTLAADLAYTAIFPALASGGCVQLIPAETATSPAALAEWFRAHPAAALKLVPSHLSALLAEAADPLALLPGEALVLGGERLPRPLYERLREIAPSLRVYNHYGPTETTVGASCLALDEEIDERCSSIPVGGGLGANVLTVVDAAGIPVPPWCPGEVVVSGPGVGLGYLGQPGFGGTYRTGDLGRLVPGGVEILGRLDDQVKLRGHRVQTGEIEAVLTELPGVGAAAVVARGDDSGLITHLDAYLVAAGALSIEQVRTAVAGRLPAAVVPTGWQVLERLPLTANGKLDRRALAPIAPPKARAGRPRDSVEQRLVAIWSAVLGQDVSSPDDDFFELGGQSLRAIKLMAQINTTFGCRLPMSAAFSAPTAAAMASLVRESGFQDSTLVLLRAARGPQAVFCVHPADGTTLAYWDLARALPEDRPVFGIESPGLHGRPLPQDLTAMAEENAAAIAAAGDAAPVLVGWGSGGIIAYATAGALRRSGREVTRLVIVDGGLAPLPGDDPVHRFAVHHDMELPAGRQDLLKAMHNAGLLAPGSGEPELQNLLDVFAANVTTLDRFFAQQHSTVDRPDFPVLLVRAETDSTEDWKSVVGPGLAVASVTATHHGILRAPAVAQLAEMIR
ncbi:AMP-binding protein [Amycolatopsis sp. NEAU-NG30]|uniref:AMP-binding protein n=1 Tax=Amycolatopsis melonis TaxID=3156488 RepID=A0ABV0LCJ7_9PSEU